MKKCRLSKEIFSRETIVSACRQFSELAVITVEEGGAYYECQFDHCLWNENTTEREFENYVIDLMNTQVHAL